MPRWSAHLGYLYTELPLVERAAAAARDGFTAVEHPAPFEVPAQEMKARLDDLGLTFSQITTGMGRADLKEKGLAALPGREAEFVDGVKRAIDYAQVIGCPYLHPMAGAPPAEHDRNTVLHTYRGNVAQALELARDAGVRILVEAITLPGYAMPTLDAAMSLQDAFAGDIDLLFDTYHASTLGTDLESWIRVFGSRVGHVHIADHPGRGEPGSGHLRFEPFLQQLLTGGYDGAIGFEYVPSRTTSETLGFLPAWKALTETTDLQSMGDER